MFCILKNTSTLGACDKQCYYCREYQKGRFQEDSHPVPAIREWYEWGWNITENQPVLMHVHCGPFSD